MFVCLGSSCASGASWSHLPLSVCVLLEFIKRDVERVPMTIAPTFAGARARHFRTWRGVASAHSNSGHCRLDGQRWQQIRGGQNDDDGLSFVGHLDGAGSTVRRARVGSVIVLCRESRMSRGRADQRGLQWFRSAQAGRVDIAELGFKILPKLMDAAMHLDGSALCRISRASQVLQGVFAPE